MRIVGGQWRGRRLRAPAGRATRPTADRVREAIFDVLGAAPPPVAAAVAVTEVAAVGPGDGPLAGVAVLDLFAGSGALGLEALSRGAASCTFVEQAPVALRALRANLAALEAAADSFAVFALDYRRALKADAASARRYNLVLVDAPYASYPAVEPELAGRLPGVLSNGAVVVVETARGQAVELALSELSVRLYGDTRVTFLQARS
jgi:16S rRNA (guanine966-N2)-methyltransferase